MRRRLLLLLAVCTLGIGESLKPERWSSRRLNNVMNRVRRNEPCPKKSQYRPYGKTFCCENCGRGHFKIGDCKDEFSVTKCDECKAGTFLKYENHEKRCRSCLVCDPVFQQIEKKECTIYSDRVCGCPHGMYQSRIDSTTFNCKNCSSCEHGVRRECFGFDDTVCDCDRDHYYHSQKKMCQPCDSCEVGVPCSPLCKKIEVEGNGDLVLLSVAILACSALTLIAIITVGYQIYRKWKRPTVPKHQSETGNSSDSELAICNSDTLLPIQEVTASPPTVVYPTPITELPDCVRIAGASQLPNNSQVNYIIADLVPLAKWKEFVRRLGMSDRDIERSEMDNRHSYREAQYEMVKLWRDKQGGRGATTEAICKVLKEMDLNGCAEQFQEALQ